MGITASQLRADVYKLIDHVIESGEVLEIERKGVTVHLSLPERMNRLDRLTGIPDLIIGDPDDLVDIDWSSEWRPFLG